MTTALIGHSGFVGGNLLRQTEFDDLYRSSDIDRIAGRHYEVVVCAGAPAEKWKANQAPEADRASVERLLRAVEQAEIGHLILISTVDVYPEPIDVDEETPIDPAAGHAYGRHRLLIERRVAARFDTTILRLPALFGPGLKKNVVYDLLHDNQVEKIPADGSFQFYPLGRLWSDITTVRAAGLGLVNFATEPVTVRDIAREAFGFEFDNPRVTAAPRYDFRTRHAERLGGSDGYLMDRKRVLAEMAAFVTSQGWKPQ